jgi:hypothetical protein
MPTDQTSGDTTARIAELEAENKRLLAELGTAREMRPPTGMWQVAVTVPMNLPREMHEALFEAIAEVAHDWEPTDRDGWDVDVSGHPVPPPCPDARAHDVTAQTVARWALDQLGRCVEIFAYIVMDTEEDRARHAQVVSLFRRAKEAGEKRLTGTGTGTGTETETVPKRVYLDLASWCMERAAELSRDGRPNAATNALWDVIDEIRRRAALSEEPR